MIRNFRKSIPEILLVVLFVLAFLMGGSARADTLSLVILRPLAFVLLALALVYLPRERYAANRGLIWCAFAWAGLTALHLVPLPPGLWQALPGRELAASVDAAAGLEGQWRPLSLVPYRTLNALFALALPIAALLLALSVPRDKLARIVFLLLAFVIASMVLGLLQVIGNEGNIFYLYRVTNAESAVGLFANRNHNAVFLALGFPLIAATLSLIPAAAEQVRLREWAGAGVAILFIPFLLTTQSRAGILIGLITIAAALWVYRSPQAKAQKRRKRRQIDPRLLFGAIAAVAIVTLTLVFTATNSIERLGRTGSADDELRLQIWPPIAQLAGEYFPWGSGIGTFVEIYAVAEPEELLQPQFVNHAHNDWLEIAVTGGLPFLLLLVLAIAIVLRRGLKVLRSARDAQRAVLARLGAVIVAVLALASVYDYPLRTPALAVLFALSVVFLAGRWSPPAGRGPVLDVGAK